MVLIVLTLLMLAYAILIREPCLTYSKKGHTCKIHIYKNGSMERTGIFDCPKCEQKLRGLIGEYSDIKVEIFEEEKK